jgi:dTDP-glucose 4,6-dehydratase
MKLLVTGGAGFIGSNYVRNIVSGKLKEVSQITILDKLTYAGNLNNLKDLPKDSYEFINGDICDERQVKLLVARNDLIVNFAAETHVDRSIQDSKVFIETNISGVQNLLNAVLSHDSKTFVQISTDEVYGSIPQGKATEEFPLEPNSPYAASKASADLIVRAYYKTYGLNVKVTRCTNNYGPFQFPEKIIPLFVTRILSGQKVPVYGDGRNIREWIHVDDHCRGVHLAALYGSPGEVYNIGGGTELSNLDLTQKILNRLNKNESSVEYVKDRPGHDFRYSVSYEKITATLGYHPEISFDSGIQTTIDWYLNNRSWWSSQQEQIIYP